MNQFCEDGFCCSTGGAASHQQLLAGTGHSDVEFAVDGTPVLLETIDTKEIKLVRMDGKRVDDDVAQTALITLYGVDADELMGMIPVSSSEPSDSIVSPPKACRVDARALSSSCSQAVSV